MSIIWLAILAGAIGREGRPSSLPAAPPRPAVSEASTARHPGSTPRLVPGRHAGHRRIGPDSSNPADDAFEDGLFDEEEGEESSTIDLDLAPVDLEFRFVGNRPPSSGGLGRLPSPDPTSPAPLHLRC